MQNHFDCVLKLQDAFASDQKVQIDQTKSSKAEGDQLIPI